MRLLRKVLERRFFLLHLLIVGATRTYGIKVFEAMSNKTEITPSQGRREATTTAPLLKSAANDKGKLTLPMKDLVRNVSSGVFRPSVHLGEIEQPSAFIRMNPFNSVQHVNFENNVQLDTRREHLQDFSQDAYQGSSILDEATRPSKIKFQDDNDQQVVTEYAGLSFNDANVKHMLVGQMFQNVEKPIREQESPTAFGKTMTDHQLMTGTYLDTSPYVVGYYSSGDQNANQPPSHEITYEIMKRPENGMLVLQHEESTYTRKRKFPYQFYQPSNEYHNVKYAEVLQHPTVAYPQMRKMSPWKKIVRLISTFLPLGLLLATLTPKIVRINNTTQPNIVLSKLRVADLPVEHKHTARLLDDESVPACEDRSICELILAGSEPESNILQNIMWILATRISDDVATRNGLREVFDAVRKKDCTTITC